MAAKQTSQILIKCVQAKQRTVLFISTFSRLPKLDLLSLPYVNPYLLIYALKKLDLN